MTYQILHGNNLDILPTLADNSIDSIVTDPPYELGFMGKKWDSSGIAYSVELWQQCLRVLKPGGHLLSFGGTRTYHRVAVAIEDAGFELRDSIAWLYGSGFPKSLDVSKAIDKSDATEQRRNRDLMFVAWMKTTGLSATRCDEILKAKDLISPTSSHSIHYFNTGQPAVATAKMFDALRPYLPEVPKEIEKLVAERTVESENYKNREVIGTQVRYNEPSGIVNVGQGERELIERKITLSATPEAQQWQGWGTALKPAFEPVIVARKPIEGTVANNVLKWGTGGLNIDGSRIGTEQRNMTIKETGFGSNFMDDNWQPSGNSYDKTVQGRWPANIILDPYTAELLDEQSGQVKGNPGAKQTTDFRFMNDADGKQNLIQGNRKDIGGASRFFYVAKASKRDRNEGLEDLDAQRHSDRELADGVGGDNPRNRTNQAKQNFHPTVKPTSLMEYLIKLVTPANGTVLDPFTGSGSTGKAAILQGFDFIGIEMTEEYLPIIEGRLKHAEAKVAERIKETANQEQEKLF
jgi:DNA modification methylase